MKTIVKTYHHIISNNVSVSEIGLSDQLPKSKLNGLPADMSSVIHYKKIKTVFMDYGEHKLKYIWGDGIECMWEDNRLRTCYYPWDYRCSAWNAAKLETPTPIHKIVIHSSSNQQRNLGLKIQTSTSGTDWKTIYTMNRFDIQKLQRSPLSIFFSDSTEYSYIRIIQENSSLGYDIETLQIFACDDPDFATRVQNSLFFVLRGSAMIHGIRYRAPFGILKLYYHSVPVVTNRSEEMEVLWISFQGASATDLLNEANFNLDSQTFDIKSKTYFQFLNHFATDLTNGKKDENQFHLLSDFFEILALHSEQNELQADPQSIQNDYVIKALQYIDAHKYEDVSLFDIAQDCQISEKYLIRIFKERVGSSPIQYLNKWKIQRAKKMLQTTQEPISIIAEKLNFHSSEYFCKLFKKYEGCSPTHYKKIYQNKKDVK